MQPLDLDTPVSRQSWDWLAELGSRLNVTIEVLDGDAMPVCPVGTTLDAAIVRQMLTSDSPIRTALAAAVHSKTPVSTTAEGLQAVWLRLAPAGMLLLVRRLDADDSIDECREDLELIGAWLAGAIEPTLAQPNAISVEGYRLRSFRRILREAAARGSMRKVLAAFVEALSVWDDVRVRAYVSGARDGFVEYASSMAAHPPVASGALDEAIVPPHGRMVRLTRADVDRVDLAADPGDLAILRMAIGTATDWVLVFSGMISDLVLIRLRVYSDLLRESLHDVLTTTTSRIVAELARRQTPVSESLPSVAQTALSQLTAATGGRRGGLAITTAAGRQAFSIGDPDLFAAPDRVSSSRLIVRSSDAGSLMTVVVERDHPPFTAFEREIAEAGAAAMHPWIETALQRSHDIERRRNFRPVDAAFDQLATAAVAAGQHASVIVIAVEDSAPRPGLLHSWVARIRGQLRGGDRAGMLSDHEIAVLLCGTSADQAVVVSARLREMVESADATHDEVRPAIGMTTRVPDAPFEGSLVGAARASAAAAAR